MEGLKNAIVALGVVGARIRYPNLPLQRSHRNAYEFVENVTVACAEIPVLNPAVFPRSRNLGLRQRGGFPTGSAEPSSSKKRTVAAFVVPAVPRKINSVL